MSSIIICVGLCPNFNFISHFIDFAHFFIQLQLNDLFVSQFFKSFILMVLNFEFHLHFIAPEYLHFRVTHPLYLLFFIMILVLASFKLFLHFSIIFFSLLSIISFLSKMPNLTHIILLYT